jgi:hypothetical protein
MSPKPTYTSDYFPSLEGEKGGERTALNCGEKLQDSTGVFV